MMWYSSHFVDFSQPSLYIRGRILLILLSTILILWSGFEYSWYANIVEVERNLQDSSHVVRNIMLNPRLVPCGGALEMALAAAITEKGKSMEGVRQWPYKSIARALEVGMRQLDIWDPLSAREQVLKTTVETSVMLLRIDDIVSGTKKSQQGDGATQEMPL
ncbi:hypothetical protein OESDEN_08153 [Oesophagostomum dentatum]|uniref:Uncharacterized protein n=1 Tax=Oesophagostomum dentatum TaxID=61180 RepID=A0A0B1T316_OESDE|nr:hypothetical protein OESDEN_08153 [Oesophagostomum dentatum]